MVKRLLFFCAFWAEGRVWGDMQSRTEQVTLVSICLTLTRISSHMHTLCRAHANTDTCVSLHTHTQRKKKAASISAQQFSSGPISPGSTVTEGWAEEFCDAPLQSCRRMNGLSVQSAVSPRPKRPSWTGNDWGMWWHNSGSGGSLV